MMIETNRLEIILNNVLDQLCRYIEWTSNDEYLAWLRTEVGVTEEEIEELRKKNRLPLPF